jgi:hypothetical protein
MHCVTPPSPRTSNDVVTYFIHFCRGFSGERSFCGGEESDEHQNTACSFKLGFIHALLGHVLFPALTLLYDTASRVVPSIQETCLI